MNFYKRCFTAQRLSKYAKNTNSEKEIIEKYFWNIQLSKELYVLIALFEVSFRNHINLAINEHFNKNWLLDNAFIEHFLTENELKSYFIAFNRLIEKNKLTADNLLVELNLGFWVNLFKKIYAPRLWHKKCLEPSLKSDALEICQFEAAWKRFRLEINNEIC